MAAAFRFAAWMDKQFEATQVQVAWLIPPQPSEECDCYLFRQEGFVINLTEDRKHYNPGTLVFVQIPQSVVDVASYLSDTLMAYITGELQRETEKHLEEDTQLVWHADIPLCITSFILKAFEESGALNLGSKIVKGDDSFTCGVFATDFLDRIFLQPLKKGGVPSKGKLTINIPAWLNPSSSMPIGFATPPRRKRPLNVDS